MRHVKLHQYDIAPRRGPPITATDIGWAAGFLDGEGCFQFGKNGLQVTANQKYTPSLEKLKRIFGGSIRYASGTARTPQGKQVAFYSWYWVVSTRGAAAAMLTLYSLMSPYRQGQIRHAIDRWKATPWNGSFRKYGYDESRSPKCQ
jgi:hypothetical protein